MTAKGSARDALLKAGEQLLSRPDGVDLLNCQDVATAAGISEDVFRATFDSVVAYRHELLGYLMDVVRAAALRSATESPRAGMDRIWSTIEAFLDANLRHPAMRSLAYALRADEVAQDMLKRRAAGYSNVFRLELDALDKPDAGATARLFTILTVETARAEHEAHHALADMRRALYALLKGYVG